MGVSDKPRGVIGGTCELGRKVEYVAFTAGARFKRGCISVVCGKLQCISAVCGKGRSRYRTEPEAGTSLKQFLRLKTAPALKPDKKKRQAIVWNLLKTVNRSQAVNEKIKISFIFNHNTLAVSIVSY